MQSLHCTDQGVALTGLVANEITNCVQIRPNTLQYDIIVSSVSGFAPQPSCILSTYVVSQQLFSYRSCARCQEFLPLLLKTSFMISSRDYAITSLDVTEADQIPPYSFCGK